MRPQRNEAHPVGVGLALQWVRTLRSPSQSVEGILLSPRVEGGGNRTCPNRRDPSERVGCAHNPSGPVGSHGVRLLTPSTRTNLVRRGRASRLGPGKRRPRTSIARLREAVTAFHPALQVRTREAAPMDWAMTQNNLGIALRWLGELEANPRHVGSAEAAFTECLSARPEEAAPFLWATTQWNLADLALARHALAPDPALLVRAQGHLVAALRVFAADENTRQLAECARLQAKIDAA